MLGRQFNKLIKRIDPKSRSNVHNIPSDTVPAEDQGQKRREIKAEEFNAMVVKDMGIFELNVLPFLRNKRKE